MELNVIKDKRTCQAGSLLRRAWIADAVVFVPKDGLGWQQDGRWYQAASLQRPLTLNSANYDYVKRESCTFSDD